MFSTGYMSTLDELKEGVRILLTPSDKFSLELTCIRLVGR